MSLAWSYFLSNSPERMSSATPQRPQSARPPSNRSGVVRTADLPLGASAVTPAPPQRPPTAGHAPKAPARTPTQREQRSAAAQARWSEKRNAVKTSVEVMRDIASRIRDTEARALLATGTSVRVCDRPQAGKFTTVFHRPSNLDLQLEAHRSLMNTKFAGQEERLVREEPSFSFRESSSATNLHPMSASNAVGTDPSPSPRKPQSRPSSAPSQRPTTLANSAAQRSAVTGNTTFSQSQSGPMGIRGTTIRPEFRTVWHEGRCDDMRLAAIHNLSLGIFKEPFVPTSERVKFRCDNKEAQYPFEDARRAAEAASAGRPATPRSVLGFFGVEDDSEYGQIDAARDSEWRSRVLQKIHESDRKMRIASRASQRSAASTGNIPPPQKMESGAISPKHSNRTPVGGYSIRKTLSRPQSAKSVQPPAAAVFKSTKNTAVEPKPAADPKDVYAWSEEVVPPAL